MARQRVRSLLAALLTALLLAQIPGTLAFKAMRCKTGANNSTSLRAAGSWQARGPVAIGQPLEPGECDTWIIDTSACGSRPKEG